MGLYDTVPLRDDLPDSFESDGYEMTAEMQEKYNKSEIKFLEGQILDIDERFCKNASIFDVAGHKVIWGDIGPHDTEGMLGVYYILDERSSYFQPDEKAVKTWHMKDKEDLDHPESPWAKHIKRFEPACFDIKYIKANAIARIVDGQIQTSQRLIELHYSIVTKNHNPNR